MAINIPDNLNQKEFVINETQISKFALIFFLVVFLFLYLPFTLFWGWRYCFYGLKEILKDLIFWIIPIIILHEGLHGLIWALLNPSGFKSIKFGFNRDLLSPFTHCNIPINKYVYLIGGMSPLFFMGIIPAIISFINGNSYWYILSLFCIWTAAGDIISCYYILKVPDNYKIQDHPHKLGFILVEK